MDAKWNRLRATPPLTSSLLAVPPLHAHTNPCCVQRPSASVVSNLVLTPLDAYKQGLHPPPLTIWGPPIIPLAQLAEKPLYHPLLYLTNLKTQADPASSDPLCHQAVAKDGDQLLLTERKERLKGNKLLLLSTLFCLVCLCECVCVLPSRSAGNVSLLYTRPFGFYFMTPNLQMDGV